MYVRIIPWSFLTYTSRYGFALLPVISPSTSDLSTLVTLSSLNFRYSSAAVSKVCQLCLFVRVELGPRLTLIWKVPLIQPIVTETSLASMHENTAQLVNTVT